MAAYHAEFPCDLAKPSQVISIPHVFAMGDNESHTFTALVYDSDNPRCGLMAGSVSGVVVTPAGGTVPLLGTKESEVREITLPSGQTAQATACSITLIQGCFAYAGQIVIVIRLVDGDAQTAVLIARGTVTRSLTETIVDPGEVVSDISTLVANAEQAAEDAQTALAQASDIVSYAEQTGKTDAEKAQARSNIGAASAEETEIVPDTPGYLNKSGFQYVLAVEMDATTGKPVMSESNLYHHSLIDVSDQVGDLYRFDCISGGGASPCPVILSADGTVLARYTSNQTRLQETWSIPEGAKWLYIVRNITTGDTFANNRFWHKSVGSRIAEEQKAETVTDAFERLAAKIPQTVVWNQGQLTPEGSSQSSTVNIRMNAAVTVAQDCVLRVTPSAGYAYLVRFSGEHWPNFRSITRCLIPLSAGGTYRLCVSRTDGADITPDVGDTAVTIELLVGMPAAPTTDGTYALKATVSNGVPTYGWVSDGGASLMSAAPMMLSAPTENTEETENTEQTGEE